MFGSLSGNSRTVAWTICALSILLSAQAQGATASGTYTWNAATGVQITHWTSSDFECDVVAGSTDKETGLTVTSTTMASDGDVWTRSGGIAGDIVGTWTISDDATGDFWTLTYNTDGTVSFTGKSFPCDANSGGGSNAAKAEAFHSSNSYAVRLRYSDPNRTASAVTLSGPGIAGALALSYSISGRSWGSEPSVSVGTTYPAGLPFTYTFSVTDSTGRWTTTSTVSCFEQQFVTGIAARQTTTGTLTFSWTGINDTGARYAVDISDSSGNWLWGNFFVYGNSAAYDGPTLTPGASYKYTVSVQSSSACSNPTSGGGSLVMGNFTYSASGSDTSSPTPPSGTTISNLSSDCLFNWAERTYPALFAPRGAQSLNSAPYYYRHYAGTGNYVAVSSADDHIWVLGPMWGNAPLDVAPAATYLMTAGCQ